MYFLKKFHQSPSFCVNKLNRNSKIAKLEEWLISSLLKNHSPLPTNRLNGPRHFKYVLIFPWGLTENQTKQNNSSTHLFSLKYIHQVLKTKISYKLSYAKIYCWNWKIKKSRTNEQSNVYQHYNIRVLWYYYAHEKCKDEGNTHWHLGYNTEYLNIALKIAKRESYKISTSLEETTSGAHRLKKKIFS